MLFSSYFILLYSCSLLLASRLCFSGLLPTLHFSFQRRQVEKNHRLAIHFDDTFGLQATQVPRDQLPNRSNMRGEFLIAGGDGDLEPARRTDTFALGKPQQQGGQSVADCRKGEFLD